MKNPSNNPARENGKDEPETSTNQMPPKRLLEFAREYFADGFPNSDRRGCPDRVTLNSLARSGRLPDDDWRAHLFGCSECFREYRLVRAERPQPTLAIWPKISWREKLRAALAPMVRPGLGWAGASALLLFTAAVWMMRHSESNVPSPLVPRQLSQAQASPQTPPATPLARIPETQTPRMPSAAKRRAAPPVVETIVSIDLNEYVAMRDAVGINRLDPKIISLAPARTRLRLQLPEGSLAGWYTVRLLGDSDQTYFKTKAFSRNGRTLTVLPNLQCLDAKSLRLRLDRSGEAPDVFPVAVIGSTTTKKCHE